MNYFEHHIGDYSAATAHLSWDEDMAYTRLLRAYYHHERGIADGQQYRLARATTPAQRKAVDVVLQEFFVLADGVHTQKRADAEIAKYAAKSGKARASANARWAHTERNANASIKAMRTHSEGNANAMLTKHQAPDTSNQTPEIQNPTQSATSTEAGRACFAMRRAGLGEANPGHPDLLALLDAGATEAEFSGAATEALKRGKGFAYAIGMLKRQRKEAAELVLHSGALPAAETEFQRAARERMEQFAPSAAAKKPGQIRPLQTVHEVTDATAKLLG